MDCDRHNSLKNDYKLKNGRPKLGVYSEKIFLEKLSMGIQPSGEMSTSGLEPEKCGLYLKNSIIKADIIYQEQLNFFFLDQVISKEQQEMMDQTPSIMFSNGHSMYAANPHNSSIGEKKLFLDDHTVRRCQIMDLYCRNDDGTLRLKTKILLTDEGRYECNVDYSYIFDYPQIISHYQDIEPGAKHARLSLGFPVSDSYNNLQISGYFKKLLENSNRVRRCRYDIKILYFESDTYFVDVIHEGKSFASMIVDRFKGRELKRFFKKKNHDSNELSLYLPVRQMLPSNTNRPFRLASFVNNENTLSKVWQQTYIGALEFFKRYLQFAMDSNCTAKSHVQRRLSKIITIDWLGPDHVSIQPSHGYVRSHRNFMQMLSSLSCVKDAETSKYHENKPFHVGEHILFRNTFNQPELGLWLRGVVVKSTFFDRHGLVVGSKSGFTNKAYCKNKNLLDAGTIDLGDIFYIVRSTDYGFRGGSSHKNMRHVSNKRELKSLGTYTLRCRLFGVSCLPRENNYSQTCLDVMDSWIRQKILKRDSGFFVLFRTNLFQEEHYYDESRQYDNLYEISLFRRDEPFNDYSDCCGEKQRQTRYKCLNWHLIERGLASGTCLYNSNKSSNVQLEEHVLNELMTRNMI